MSRAEFVIDINKEKESERKRERDVNEKKEREREIGIFHVKFQNLTKRQFQKCKVKITQNNGRWSEIYCLSSSFLLWEFLKCFSVSFGF